MKCNELNECLGTVFPSSMRAEKHVPGELVKAKIWALRCDMCGITSPEIELETACHELPKEEIDRPLQMDRKNWTR